MYTVTLFDLATWKEVDIKIDERLPVKADMSGKLLGSRLSIDGELWVAYLEKACAAHCGGWDKIHGGACTHAWSILTGCKYQYDIHKNPQTGKYYALGKFNPHKKKWEDHYNCPHDGNGRLWKVDWPEVGGGGSRNKEITKEEMFQKMCAWDKENYIVGAATSGAGGMSSAGQDDGLVDDHAYSVIECHANVAGTGVDMLKVRNPWGKGEIEDGQFDDDGPGWKSKWKRCRTRHLARVWNILTRFHFAIIVMKFYRISTDQGQAQACHSRRRYLLGDKRRILRLLPEYLSLCLQHDKILGGLELRL
jgi:Calpain family cysteine protease